MLEKKKNQGIKSVHLLCVSCKRHCGHSNWLIYPKWKCCTSLRRFIVPQPRTLNDNKNYRGAYSCAPLRISGARFNRLIYFSATFPLVCKNRIHTHTRTHAFFFFLPSPLQHNWTAGAFWGKQWLCARKYRITKNEADAKKLYRRIIKQKIQGYLKKWEKCRF